MAWPKSVSRRMRDEAHYGDRVVRCFADRPASLDAMFRAAVAAHGDREALVVGNRRYRYRDLDGLVEAVAANLAAAGLGAGDRIALLSGNRAEFVLVALAALRLGAIGVPLGHRLRAAELEYMLKDSGAAMLVVEAALADRLPERGRLPGLRQVYAFGGVVAGADRFEALLIPGVAPPIKVGEEDVAFILYTSGTTGRPKGAMLTHLNIVHSALHYAECMALSATDRTLMAVPVSHVTGLVAQLLTLINVGGCTVMMDEFKAPAALELLERERITHGVFVPAMYALLLRQPGFDAARLGSLRIGGFGGAPMPEPTIVELAAKLPGLTLINAYGATETASPATVLPPGRIADHRSSVGIAVPCAEIRVMDEEGRELPPGTAGEIWIGGPMVVPGYWRNPEATAESFIGGFWRSGDIGSVDRDGFVAVLDRQKDMINRGGYKVFSAEVESVLSAHPAVAESAVVARPCPVLGERVHAFVVPAGDEIDPQALSDWCAERLADYKVPETFTPLAELPRNANGKILKADLRARAMV